MRLLLAVVLLLTSLPTAAITGFKAPEPMIRPLVQELLEEASLLLKINIPSEFPIIYLASREEIINEFCKENEPCSVVAITDGNTGIIYLDAKMELNNIYNVSVLYHELIHFLQVKNNMFVNLEGCHKWAAAEMHAYKAQSQWLNHHLKPGFRVPDLNAQCVD